MPNLGYCRFENTLSDLYDCYEHLHDADMTDEEKKARKRLARLCRLVADEAKDNGFWEP